MTVPNPPDGDTALDRSADLDDELTRGFVSPFLELPAFPADDSADVDTVGEGDGDAAAEVDLPADGDDPDGGSE